MCSVCNTPPYLVAFWGALHLKKRAELLRRFFQIANFFVLSLAQLHRRSIIAFKCTENR